MKSPRKSKKEASGLVSISLIGDGATAGSVSLRIA
jgi:hypothetical protein